MLCGVLCRMLCGVAPLLDRNLGKELLPNVFSPQISRQKPGISLVSRLQPGPRSREALEPTHASLIWANCKLNLASPA